MFIASLKRRLSGAFGTLAVLALLPGPASAQLNDSGQLRCYDAAHAVVDCATADAERPGQDARFGRDAARAAGRLPARSGEPTGFDFTALDAAGGMLTAPGEHACVRDNVTGLVWSAQTLPSLDWSAAGEAAGSYSRCGLGSGWRLPTRRELLSIVHYGRNEPAIDGDYFPDTPILWYWTADRYARPDPFDPEAPARAWLVVFYSGDLGRAPLTEGNAVRLVHDAP